MYTLKQEMTGVNIMVRYIKLFMHSKIIMMPQNKKVYFRKEKEKKY